MSDNKVKALDIWGEIANSELCQEARKFYSDNKKVIADSKLCQEVSNYPYDKKVKYGILTKGSANFDERVLPNNQEEKALYRTAYYCGNKGYMNMHLKQCRVAFKKYLEKLPKSSQILFVDYGCGPMTAGLALAEILSPQLSHIHYHGIDASKNMVEMAQRINKEHKVFDNFKVIQENRLNPTDLPTEKFDIAILSFSYVLARDTCNLELKDMEKMAKIWHEAVLGWQCEETRIIYQNPKEYGGTHGRWNAFKEALQGIGKSGQDSEIGYACTGLEDCKWQAERKSKMEKVTGKKNA